MAKIKDRNISLLANTYNKDFTMDMSDRIPYSRKIAKEHAWFKAKINYYDTFNARNAWTEKANRIQRNYDIYNGVIDEEIFKPVTNYLNIEDWDNPVKMEHVDIISLPLREIIGSEIKRPWEPVAIAVNPEAVSAKEKERIDMLKQHIYAELMWPIEQQLIEKYPDKDEREEQAKAYQQDLEAMKPADIDVFMQTQFRLPEESLAQDLIDYLTREHKLDFIFNRGWEKAVISGEEVYYVGQKNGRQHIELVDNRYFNYDMSAQHHFIHEAEWFTYEKYMLISDIYDEFSEEIEADKDLQDRLDKLTPFRHHNDYTEGVLLDYDYDDNAVIMSDRKVRVLHTVFKSLKKIKFIETTDLETGQPTTIIVDETYKFNPLVDISESSVWIPEYLEGYKIDEDLFLRMRPVPHQYRNLNDPFKIKGPYMGVSYGLHNGTPISLTDRGFAFQFLYDVIWFRLMETIATDRGNIMLALIKQLPEGWSPKEWLQYLVTSKVGFIDPSQDTESIGSDPQYWKSINLSASADVQKYLQMLDYCEQRCLRAIGSNENRIGTVSPTESVTNNQQKIVQSSNITEPDFYLHNILKEEVVTGLLEQAKISFRNNPRNISFITSDLNIKSLFVDPDLLESAEFAVYASNSTRDHSIVQSLRNRIDQIVQASQGDFRFLTEVVTTNNPERLKEMASKVSAEKQQQMQAQQQMQSQQIESQQQMEQARMKNENEQKQLDREYKLKEAMIKAMGFANNTDTDENKVPDMLEMAKFNAEFENMSREMGLKTRELTLREKELVENNISEERDRQVQREKIKADIEKEKIKAKNKPTNNKK
jgi:hypothetical protein